MPATFCGQGRAQSVVAYHVDTIVYHLPLANAVKNTSVASYYVVPMFVFCGQGARCERIATSIKHQMLRLRRLTRMAIDFFTEPKYVQGGAP